MVRLMTCYESFRRESFVFGRPAALFDRACRIERQKIDFLFHSVSEIDISFIQLESLISVLHSITY